MRIGMCGWQLAALRSFKPDSGFAWVNVGRARLVA
jgi:hypothetical protein